MANLISNNFSCGECGFYETDTTPAEIKGARTTERGHVGPNPHRNELFCECDCHADREDAARICERLGIPEQPLTEEIVSCFADKFLRA